MSTIAGPGIRDPRVRGNYPNLRSLLRFYDFSAAWSLEELEKLCKAENLPSPGSEDR